MSAKNNSKPKVKPPKKEEESKHWWVPIAVAVIGGIALIIGDLISKQSPPGLPTAPTVPPSSVVGIMATVISSTSQPSGLQIEVPTTIPFTIKSVGFDPPSPSAAQQIKIFACTTGYGGVGITLRVSVNTSPNGTDSGEWKILKELGVPCFSQDDAPVWDTSTWPSGKYLVKIAAKAPNDPNWQRPIVVIATYELLKP